MKSIFHKEEYITRTSDNFSLRLIRYWKKSEDTLNTPVVLCHGLAANKHSVDFGDYESKNKDDWESYSLACYLSNYKNERKYNFDVWVVELRGRNDCDNDVKPYIWTIDDYINIDLPTILSYIQNFYCKKYKEKKNFQIHWIGKSMGGMIAYAYGQKEEGNIIFKSVTTIGSPTAFNYWNLLVETIARMTPRNISITVNPAEFFKNHPKIKEEFKKVSANAENIEEDILDKYLEIGMDNKISSKVLNQFMMFYRHNDFCEYPKYPWMYDIFGRISIIKWFANPKSYKNNLEQFKIPLYGIAGGKDNASPISEVRYSCSNVSSDLVLYKNFEKYGHLDLNLGKNVKEVYKKIYDWLIYLEEKIE